MTTSNSSSNARLRVRNLLQRWFDPGKTNSQWIGAAICALAMACFSVTPALAQCTLNGSPDITCALGPVTTINTYTDTSGSNNVTTTSGTLTLASPGTMTIFGGVELVNDTSLTGSTGTLTLNAGQISTSGNFNTLTNAGATIQGSGTIGFNGRVSLNNSGTINANTPGTLGIAGGLSFINSGTFEATGGGTLALSTQAAIDNSGGNITSTGTGSTVNVGTSIQGGTLNTSNGGIMQTSGTATLDATSNGAITLSDGSTYTAGAGTTNITGTLNLGTSTGGTLALAGNLQLTGNAILAGPGLMSMNGGQIGTNDDFFTLTNGATIQGSGTIGSNSSPLTARVSLNNSGTINANTPGTLGIAGTGLSFINSGTFEATGGGTLALSTQAAIDNSGGNITSTGTGSTVNVGTTIQGGTLNTSNGGMMQTLAGSQATLSGNTSAGAITISDGSTYTSGGTAGTLTQIVGTLNLGTVTGGTLALGGQLQLTGNATLGGPGSISMTGGQIGSTSNFLTLTNGATIQGSGVIGSNIGTLTSRLTLINSGTLLANVSGQTLTLSGTGTGGLTNSGTMQANAGSTLLATQGFTNFSGGTLTGGTYNAIGTTGSPGTIQIDALGSAANGGEIVNNAATILLNGTNANITDANNKDALLNSLVGNSGSITILNGRNLATPGAFTNTSSSGGGIGYVEIGSTDTFTVNDGDSAYTQTGANSVTRLDGENADLFASLTDIQGGLLTGTGSLQGNLTDEAGGTVAPGTDSAAGFLYADGNYIQSGDLILDLFSQSIYDTLDIGLAATFGGTLTLDSDFQLQAGQTYYLIDYGTDNGSTFANVNTSGLDLNGLTATIKYDQFISEAQGSDPYVELVISGTSSATPEPSTWFLFAGGLGTLAAFQLARRRRATLKAKA